jgi:hypothetical protein
MEGDSLNRGYEDLSGITWADTRAAMELEDSVLDRLVADAKAFDASLEEDVELYEDICMTLQGLDLGMASAVFALNASGCLTFSSCSGQQDHRESFPLVVFRARAEQVPTLIKAAEDAECGLENAEDGMLMLYSPDLRRLPAFAKAFSRLMAPSA